jgi:hypothetical protein
MYVYLSGVSCLSELLLTRAHLSRNTNSQLQHANAVRPSQYLESRVPGQIQDSIRQVETRSKAL